MSDDHTMPPILSGPARSLARAVTAFAIATVVAILFTVQMFASHRYVGDARPWTDLLVYQVIDWWSWVLLTPAVIAAARRWPLDRRPSFLTIVGHVAFGAFVVATHAAIIASVLPALYWPVAWAPWRDVLLGQVNKSLAVNGLVYVLIGVVWLMVRSRRLSASPTDQVEKPRLAGSRDAPFLDRIAFRVDGRLVVVAIDDISRVDAADNYVLVHAGAQQHRVRATVGALEQQLDSRRFVRIHRSTIVALDRVVEVRPWFRGELLVAMQDGTRVKVSRTYRERLLSLIPRPV